MHHHPFYVTFEYPQSLGYPTTGSRSFHDRKSVVHFLAMMLSKAFMVFVNGVEVRHANDF